MIKNRYIIIFISALFFMSCEDYLDKQDPDDSFATEDEVWQDKNKINSMAFRLYDTTEWMFETRHNWGGRQDAGFAKNYANTMVFSGEVIYNRHLGVEDAVKKGDYFTAINTSYANPDFHDVWYDCWEAIYVANSILDRIDEVPSTVFTDDERNQVKGEALLFRALSYHELSKRWGALPYLKEKILPDTDLNLPRPTFLEETNAIVSDIDAAIAVFPEVSYLNHPQNMGRMGVVAAMALKSRVLTIAASPNYTPNNQKVKELWERAANAAWEVIQLSQTSDKVGLYQGEYNHIFHTEPGTIEGLWPRYSTPISPSSDAFTFSFAWKFIGGYAGYGPSQELVDKFETADGFRISEAGSTYNDQNPYENRDPRFYLDILYHDAPWAKTTEADKMDLRTEPLGVDRDKPNTSEFGNSSTGYLIRKQMPNKFNKKSYNNAKYINAPYIRMAEMYLNYAEAVNEAFENPNATAEGASLTAVQAINVIRNRVGHVDVRAEYASDYLTFQKTIRNEFAVELCFEYHSWFDMLRWRTAKEELNGRVFHGVYIIDDASQPMGVRFEKFPINQNRIFEDRNYRYPIKESDLQTFEIPNLTQNPGW
ncbi:RagB/SusD family nutrient uptake outer membrane protein [Flavicella sediminum]|uniref:RagB/SusD family nutrient uptake outer membrane protein n=1 Tax=Flavicella sediminum TaxID=2585141 RepID=UPI001122DE1F|nr:RagB/SusD family nutrient uptake outer membrane protein [Flavicella sediminum]